MEIKTIKRENCIIHICDDAIVKTKAEQEKIWKNFSDIAYRICLSVRTKEEKTNE